MTAYDLVVRAARAVTRSGERGVSLGVTDGRIAAVAPPGATLVGAQVLELRDDEVLLPGLVDTHVHVDEPGRTEWEGFAAATRAAAAGGITTLVDMPLNSLPPTVDVAALEVKRAAALGQCHVDVGFWGGAVPGNVGALRGLHEAGVFGVKCFLVDSGVAEFPPLSRAELRACLQELARLDALLVVHAEDAGVIARAPSPAGTSYDGFLASRPPAAEDTAVATVVAETRRSGGRTHVLHLASADAVPLLRAARAEGLRITAETCPHYLLFEAAAIADGATQFKCCPPIRDAGHRERLWAALADGDVVVVVSDHSPCTPELKRLDVGDFALAWGGISSLQLGLPAVWTGARERGHGLVDVVRWMAEGPARLVGLRGKGRLEVGADADLCVLAPDEPFVVDPARLHSRSPVTPYAGRTLTGVVRSTWLAGGRVDLTTPRGRLLVRGAA